MTNESSNQQPIVVATTRSNPGCLVTLLWFIFVGWWLSAIWIIVAWVLIVLVVTMPIGLVMLNKLPMIVSLRPETTHFTVQGSRLQETNLEQYPLLVRVVYGVLIGWWLSLLWMGVAWIACASMIGIPLGIWMFNRVPAITTLRRY